MVGSSLVSITCDNDVILDKTKKQKINKWYHFYIMQKEREKKTCVKRNANDERKGGDDMSKSKGIQYTYDD